MNSLTYYIPNDIHAYIITCNDEMLEMYKSLLIENGAYKIFLDGEVIYNAK